MNSRTIAFDLETTNLKANFGRLLVACFTDVNNGDVVSYRADAKKYKAKDLADDSALAADIKYYLEESWCWITWNGKMFDVPYLNTRLRLAGLQPVERRLHIDLMYYARRPNLNLHSSRLDAMAKAFELTEQKTQLDPKTWVNAMLLKKEAIDYIVEHCIQDVLILKEAFPILMPFIRNIHY